MPNLTNPTALATLFISFFLAPTNAQAVTQIITLTSTLAASTVTLAAASTPTNLPETFTNADSFQFSILNSTNYFRYLHPAAYLTYNATLAAFAQSYSEKCNWEHNSALGEVGYGENLAKGYATPGGAVDAWGNEGMMFDFDTDGYTGFTEETGHFSQLVWRGTRGVGCGWTDCSNTDSRGERESKSKRGDIDSGIFLVCNYFPAGNIMAPEGDGGDVNMFFKQNVVPERAGGAEGFDAEEAGRGVGGPSGTATESVAGTVTASAGAVRLEGFLVEGGKGGRWSAVVVGLGVVVGMGVGLF